MKTAYKAVIVVVAVIAVAFIAIMVAGSSYEDKATAHDGYYDYDLSTKTSFASTLGTQAPTPGNIFVFADVLVMNAGKADGTLGVNELYFDLETGGRQYAVAYFYTLMYPGYNDNHQIPLGKYTHYIYIYEVPIWYANNMSDMHVIYTGSEDIKYDPEYVLERTQKTS